jgi:hypothetical protein
METMISMDGSKRGTSLKENEGIDLRGVMFQGDLRRCSRRCCSRKFELID